MTNRIPSYLEYLKTVAITTAGSGYTSPVTLLIDAPTGDSPIQATATATIKLNVDRQGGYADNLELETERQPNTNEKVAWSENNPFGEF